MKTKIALILVVFTLLALGTVLVTAQSSTVEPTSFEQAAQGYVVPMAGSCNYFCSKCVPINIYGACTSGKACC